MTAVPSAVVGQPFSRKDLAPVYIDSFQTTGLRILFSATGGLSGEDLDRGQVLFLASVFVEGRDRSFVELSDFVRERGAWRYAGGVLGSAKLFADDLASLTPAAFAARVAATGR